MRFVSTAALLAALVAGCGESGAQQEGETTEAVTTAPAQTDWAARADAICVGYQARIDALPAPQTQAEAVTALRNTVTLARDELRALEALTPSAEERELARQFVDRLRAVVAATSRLADATAAANQAAQAAALADAEQAAQEAQTAADALGLAACGLG